jgi:alpha-beta hydrolase superfamily lysophospholipase
MRRYLTRLATASALVGGLAGTAYGQAAGAPASIAPCPAAVPSDATCHLGKDSAGAYYWTVMPANWNRKLVVHAHGGPDLGAPDAVGVGEDITRWAIWARLGYALVASSYHQGGVAVRAAAEDTYRARMLFAQQFGEPERTILHGQSWGAGVAARTAELFNAPAANRRRPFDGVLLTSGVLGGATHSYDFRMDLRVVYQAVCGDHPRADEPSYPLWMGLPPGAALTRAQLADRVDRCTGVRKAAAARTPEQAARLATILGAVRIPERTLIAHLNWGTWHFQDIVQKRTQGANPFATVGVRYPGTVDGAPIDGRVARYTADSAAVATLAADADPTGALTVPTLTMHGIDDPTAFVELEDTFRRTVEAAGGSALLRQVYTTDTEHSYFTDAAYATVMAALEGWLSSGRRPTVAAIGGSCATVAAALVPKTACRFDRTYQPQSLTDRVPARRKAGAPKRRESDN